VIFHLISRGARSDTCSSL